MAKFGYKQDMQIKNLHSFIFFGYLLEFGSWVWNWKLKKKLTISFLCFSSKYGY
jgi:hypothetical protein